MLTSIHEEGEEGACARLRQRKGDNERAGRMSGPARKRKKEKEKKEGKRKGRIREEARRWDCPNTQHNPAASSASMDFKRSPRLLLFPFLSFSFFYYYFRGTRSGWLRPRNHSFSLFLLLLLLFFSLSHFHVFIPIQPQPRDMILSLSPSISLDARSSCVCVYICVCTYWSRPRLS